MAGLRILNDYVLIDPDKNELVGVQAKFIHIPGKNSLEKVANTGAVVSYGSKCKLELKTGERVMFERFPADWISYEGKKYRIIRECDIKAVYA